MRWICLMLLIACGSSENPVGVAMSAPPGVDGGSDLNGLFGGTGGSSSTVELNDGGRVVAQAQDAGADAGIVQGVDAAGAADSSLADAGEDAAIPTINPQCRTCGTADSEFPDCPPDHFCMNLGGTTGKRCLYAPPDMVCGEHLMFSTSGCVPTFIGCIAWLEMYGN